MVRFQSCTFWELPLLPGSLWLELVVPVMFPSRIQIELLCHLLRVIVITYLKPYNGMKIICIL